MGERPLRASVPCAGGVGNGPPGWFLPARGAGGLCDSVWSSRSLPVSSVVPRSPEVCGLGSLCLIQDLWDFLLLLLALFSEITKKSRRSTMATPFRVRGAGRNPRTNTKGRNGDGNPRTRARVPRWLQQAERPSRQMSHRISHSREEGYQP